MVKPANFGMMHNPRNQREYPLGKMWSIPKNIPTGSEEKPWVNLAIEQNFMWIFFVETKLVFK